MVNEITYLRYDGARVNSTWVNSTTIEELTDVRYMINVIAYMRNMIVNLRIKEELTNIRDMIDVIANMRDMIIYFWWKKTFVLFRSNAHIPSTFNTRFSQQSDYTIFFSCIISNV